MSEKPPDKKDAEIVNLGEARRDKQNAERGKLAFSSEGTFIYPRPEIRTTLDEAVAESRKILLWSMRDIIRDYGERETRAGKEFPRPEALEAATAASIDNQRETSRLSTTEQLRQVLENHKRDPEHYYKTVLYSVAEELVKRLEQK
jgi:hypothetical protein